LLAALVLSPACDPSDSGSRLITHSRVASAPSKPWKDNASSADRFDATSHFGGSAASQEMPHPTAPRRKPFTWVTPPGWKQAPEGGMRVGSFSVEGKAGLDCGITIANGALEANVNRWRKQMGLAEVTPEAIAQLPTRLLLGGNAVVVELAGTYAGMGGVQQKDAKLVGVIYQLDMGERAAAAVFVKMTGPAAAIDAERKNFDALCDSMRMLTAAEQQQEPPTLPEGPPAMPPQGHGPHGPEGPPIGPAAQDEGFAWQAPAGWTQGPPKTARLVTFNVGATECYVAVLGGDGGGLLSNVNRWRGQMGATPLTDADVAGLARAKVFGQDCPLMEAPGNYTDMGGAQHAGFLMVGTICSLGDQSVFVKMVGPEAEVRAERERFVAFLASLRKS
jgi:hypothetical protein